MTRLRRGRQTGSPTLCLERLEDRQLLNGAVWWVTPLIGHGHAPDTHGSAKHTTVADVQSLTGQLLSGDRHGEADVPALAAHIAANEDRPQIHQLLHSASTDHGAGHNGWATSDDHAHGGTKHRVEDDSSPTAQLIIAAQQDEQQPPDTGKNDNPHMVATSAAQPPPEIRTDSDATPAVSIAQPTVTHVAPAAPVAQANTAAGQNKNSSSSNAGGTTHPVTGGNTGNHGTTHGGSGSGPSQNNGKGGSTGKGSSHKGPTGTPPPVHHGGAQGAGSHPISSGTKSSHAGSSADSTSTAASQSAPGADADDSDSTADQSRALALVLWEPDSINANTHASIPAGELTHDTGGGEPHGAVVMGKLDDSADTPDGIGPAGHPFHVALADGDLDLKPKPVAQPAEAAEPPPIAAGTFEWLAVADGETPAPIVAAGMPEGCLSPAELIAVGLQETQAAMKQLLAQLAQLGQQATGALTAHGAGPWLVAAVTGAVAAEVVRRRLRSQPQPILVSAAQASTSTWFPGLLD